MSHIPKIGTKVILIKGTHKDGEYNSLNEEFSDLSRVAIEHHMLSCYGVRLNGDDWEKRWIWEIVDPLKFTIFQLKHGNLIKSIE